MSIFESLQILPGCYFKVCSTRVGIVNYPEYERRLELSEVKELYSLLDDSGHFRRPNEELRFYYRLQLTSLQPLTQQSPNSFVVAPGSYMLAILSEADVVWGFDGQNNKSGNVWLEALRTGTAREAHLEDLFKDPEIAVEFFITNKLTKEGDHPVLPTNYSVSFPKMTKVTITFGDKANDGEFTPIEHFLDYYRPILEQ